MLDVIAPRERIGGERGPTLVADDLLRAERERCCLGRRQRQRLVVAVRV